MKIKLRTKMLLALVLLAGTTTWTTAAPSVTGLIRPSTVPRYAKYELDFDLTSLPANPYDSAQYNVYALFTSPAGQVYKQFAFYYEGVNYNCEAVQGPPWPFLPGNYNQPAAPFDQVVSLNLTGVKGWKVRFAAKETGTWTFRIVVDDNILQNSSITPAYPFTCTSSSSPGFVEQANVRYFRFSGSGAPFYPVGLNFPYTTWTEWRYPTRKYGFCTAKQLMDTMALQGINFFRWWINIDDAGFQLIGYDHQTGKNYLRYINQLDASQIDVILQYAETKKMYVEMCVFSHYNFGVNHGSECCWKDYNPFNSQVTHKPPWPDSPGQCDTPFEFFVNADAKKVTKDFLQYFIARWGYSTSLMGIELWNEIDQLEGVNKRQDPPSPNCPELVDGFTPPSSLKADIIAWHKEMKNHLDAIDPFNHPVSTSCAAYDSPLNSVYDFMDYTQPHGVGIYLDNPGEHPNKKLWDIAQYFTDTQTYPLTAFKKPFIQGEDFYDWKKNGVVFDPSFYYGHGAYWSTLHSGAFGPLLHWNVLDLQLNGVNAFNIYKGISTYAATLPQFSEHFNPMHFGSSTREVYYLENNNQDQIFGWMQDAHFSVQFLYNPSIGGREFQDQCRAYLKTLNTSSRPPPASSSHTLSFPVLKNGDYDVKWYDTETGLLAGSQVVSASGNNLSVTVPTVTSKLLNGIYGDAAFRITYRCAGQWNCGPLNAVEYPNIRLNSPLAVGSPPGFLRNIYYINTDNRIDHTYWVGYYWSRSVVNGSAPANVGADSDLATDAVGGVYFTGTDQRIHMMKWNGTFWDESTLKGDAEQVVAPDSALAVNAAGTEVFYVGIVGTSGRRIRWMHKSGGTWLEGPLLPGTANVHPGSDIAYDRARDRLFFTAGDRRIHYWYRNSGAWSQAVLEPGGLQNVRLYNSSTAGSSLAVDPTTGSVFFIDNDNLVRAYDESAGSWQQTVLKAGAQPARNQRSDGRFALSADELGKVFFIGMDNRIHHYYRNAGVWQEGPNNGNDPQNVMSGLVTENQGRHYFASDSRRVWSTYYGCDPEFRVKLDTTRLGNCIEFRWPATAQAFVLQRTQTLQDAAWEDVAEIPDTVDGQSVLAIEVTNEQGYYRLRRPY